MKKIMLNHKRLFSAFFVGVMIPIFGQTLQAAELKKITGFSMPESVVVADDGRIFVSEIGEFDKDNDGVISVVDQSGNRKVFATGMNDPKGLAFAKGVLYVADKTRILKVNSDGQWTVFADAAAFPVAPQFLNDLEIDASGRLYVSDSGDLKGGWGAVYRVSTEGKVTTLIDSKMDAQIQTPNGLLLGKAGSVLNIVDFTSGILFELNLKTAKLKEVARGFGGGDGIVRGVNGALYVSDWKNGKVFMVEHQYARQLSDNFKAAADIAISKDKHTILVPDMKAGELGFLPVKHK